MKGGILPKARYAMTVSSSRGSGGTVSPPVGPGQSPGGGPGGQAPGSSSDPAVHSTKKMPPKTTFLVHFYLCTAYKSKGKIHLIEKFMCKANISTSCAVNISERISW